MRTTVCRDCGEAFTVVKIKGRLPTRCPSCRRVWSNTRMREWREANPEKSRAAYARDNAKRLADPVHRQQKREDEARRLYGIEPEELQRLTDAQDGRCAICDSKPSGNRPNGARLHIDHCHERGVIRGLLCGNCNTMIGLAHEDPERLAAAITYLKSTVTGI